MTPAAPLACASILILACGGCGGDDGANPDGSVGGDGTGGGDGAGCMRPALDQPWLASTLSSVVGQLATAPRYTNTQRDTARAYLRSQLTALGLTPQTHSYPTGANVYATIPATTGETRQLIVGAHFDTVQNSPGANDNASGCAVTMAIAHYVTQMTCRKFAVTVVFFDEEEAGLFGARAFANTLTVAQVPAVHTIDQVAWDSDNDHRFELELPTTGLEADYRAAAATVGVPVSKTSTQGTDHQAFRDLGFAAIGITEEYVGGDTSPYRHTAQDTTSTVKFSYTELAAKLVAQTILTDIAP